MAILDQPGVLRALHQPAPAMVMRAAHTAHAWLNRTADYQRILAALITTSGSEAAALALTMQHLHAYHLEIADHCLAGRTRSGHDAENPGDE